MLNTLIHIFMFFGKLSPICGGIAIRKRDLFSSFWRKLNNSRKWISRISTIKCSMFLIWLFTFSESRWHLVDICSMLQHLKWKEDCLKSSPNIQNFSWESQSLRKVKLIWKIKNLSQPLFSENTWIKSLLLTDHTFLWDGHLHNFDLFPFGMFMKSWKEKMKDNKDYLNWEEDKS